METRRDQAAETEGASAIRLRYSRQFQSGGHAHTIDAEATLAVGASQERREEVIRALEADVALLARQIVQHASRPPSEAHPQAPARPESTEGKTMESAALPRPTPQATQPTASLPVSESMPATPAPGGGRPITLPYFLDYIKKRWNMSGQEAMELLDVRELTGLNLREALFKLRDIKEPPGSSNTVSSPAKTTQQQPGAEASRQTNRTPSAAPNAQAPASQPAPDTVPDPSSATARQETRSGARTTRPAPVLARPPQPNAASPEKVQEPSPNYAGSSKASLPIQIGVVRDLAPRRSYFEEEEEEGQEEQSENSQTIARRQAAESKLERLREMRSGNTVSPARLGVLSNVIGDQISEGQLGTIIKAVWGFSSKKRLKEQQVEELISWAKEDYFSEEVENLLALLEEEG